MIALLPATIERLRAAAAKSSRRCDFNPVQPNLELQDTIKRGALIDKAIAACKRRIYELREVAPDALRTRQRGRRTKKDQGQKVVISTLRAERAQAYVRILSFALPRTDIEHGDIYRWKGTRAASERFDLKDWTTHTGLSRDRLEHGLSDLHASGLLWSRQFREEDKGRYKGHVAIRKVTHELWRFLELEPERQKFLQDLADLREQREQREEEARQAVYNPPKPAEPSGPWPVTWDHLSADERKRAKRYAFALAQANPSWSVEQVNAQAFEDLALPPPPDWPPPA